MAVVADLLLIIESIGRQASAALLKGQCDQQMDGGGDVAAAAAAADGGDVADDDDDGSGGDDDCGSDGGGGGDHDDDGIGDNDGGGGGGGSGEYMKAGVLSSMESKSNVLLRSVNEGMLSAVCRIHRVAT